MLADALDHEALTITSVPGDERPNKPPTMQDLAICARICFEEDAESFHLTTPSSFDLVAGVYVCEGETLLSDELHLRARRALEDRFGSEGRTIAPRRLDLYVSKVLMYLAACYPSPRAMADEHTILSHLFWGHLVEARHAGPSIILPLPPVEDMDGNTRFSSPQSSHSRATAGAQ